MTARRRAFLVVACLCALMIGVGTDVGGGRYQGLSVAVVDRPAIEAAISPTPSEPGDKGIVPVALGRSARSASNAQVPILYYHRIQALPRAFTSWSPSRQRQFTTYDVIPTAFEAQLDWLAKHDYTTILPRDLAAHWDYGADLPARPVILTFDDGSHDWISTVLPRLRARHMVAEFYLTLDAIRWGAITWAEVRSLAAAGNGIGAHDVHHVQLTRLGYNRAPASAGVMWAEVSGARRIIASEIGVAPDSMAYVGGGFDPTLERLVWKAGYTTARSIIRGTAQSAGRRFEMRVVRIGSRDDVSDLLTGRLVAGLPTFTARMRGVSDVAAPRTGHASGASAPAVSLVEQDSRGSRPGSRMRRNR
jgi:peptidoglycan/xylan/chitin deacetylase (PgdA/CDA1 family)